MWLRQSARLLYSVWLFDVFIFTNSCNNTADQQQRLFEDELGGIRHQPSNTASPPPPAFLCCCCVDGFAKWPDFLSSLELLNNLSRKKSLRGKREL